MEKEFVPYELSVKLKALGFDEPCFGLYAPPSKTVFLHHYGLLSAKEQILAPLYQQAFRWFREKYGMYSHIKTSGKISVLEFTWVSNGKYGFFSKNGFETYEEAELACLDKLIEIVETKSE